MNNFRWIGPTQFDDFWDTNWKSPHGQAWAKSDTPLVQWMKERLRSRPFYVVTAWEPDLQRRHFSQMWGQVFERHYDNLALRDLYWVHELAHWALLDFQPSDTMQAWTTKWDDYELMASFISEVLVHGDSPDWDVAALGAPAWARRFEGIAAQTPLAPSTWSAGALAAWERRIAVRDGSVEPTDQTERWLAGFTDENARWAHVWRNSWSKLDLGLVVYDYARRHGDEDGMRASLDAAGGVNEWPRVPYRSEAEEFANKPA